MPLLCRELTSTNFKFIETPKTHFSQFSLRFKLALSTLEVLQTFVTYLGSKETEIWEACRPFVQEGIPVAIPLKWHACCLLILRSIIFFIVFLL